MKKKLKEITNDSELKKVYKNNKKLQDKVYDHFVESEMFYISDLLDTIRDYLRDYSIGFSNRNYIQVKRKDLYNLKSGLVKMQMDYNIFDSKEWLKIVNAIEDGDITTIEQEIVSKFDELTKHPKEESLIDYWISFYRDLLIQADRDLFIDEDYVLYEIVINNFK